MSSRVVKRTKRGLPRETNCLFRRGWTHAVSAWQVTSWFLSLLLALFAWGENVLSTSFIILAYLGCVSSLKFKSRFLIWKRMFHFFSNIQNRISFKFINFIIIIIKLLIQTIHKGGGLFGSYPKPDTFETWSEAFLHSGFIKSEYCQL